MVQSMVQYRCCGRGHGGCDRQAALLLADQGCGCGVCDRRSGSAAPGSCCAHSVTRHRRACARERGGTVAFHSVQARPMPASHMANAMPERRNTARSTGSNVTAVRVPVSDLPSARTASPRHSIHIAPDPGSRRWSDTLDKDGYQNRRWIRPDSAAHQILKNSARASPQSPAPSTSSRSRRSHGQPFGGRQLTPASHSASPRDESASMAAGMGITVAAPRVTTSASPSARRTNPRCSIHATS